MTEPLLSPTDFALFKARNENWFLGAAGETVRDYCGWHIYPVEEATDVSARIGNEGIIMLPSLNIVSVEAVRLNGIALPVEDYEVHSAGWLQLVGGVHAGSGLFGPQQRVQGHNRYVSVDFTHGFTTMPKAVAEVGFELTGRTLEKPSGVVKSLEAGPHKFVFNEFGAVLSKDQESRLDPYRVVEV
jgi:hypothetical protein